MQRPSSGSGSAISWNVLGHGDCSTANGSLGSHGQGSSDDSRNTRRRLDTFSSHEDEHARSAVLPRFPCEQYHTGITNWINNLWEKSNIPALNKPVRIHCKAGSVSARLVFDLVARYRDDGITNEIDSPFCNTKTVISVRQSKSLEDREIGKQFAPLWKVLAEQLKILFPEGDGVSIKDRRNGVGKPVFKLAPSGSGQLFTLVAPDLCCVFLVFLVKCCRRSSLKPARPM